MSCVLRATGHDFDVDSFLTTSTLKPLITFHRGHHRFANSTAPMDDCSGMNVSVSEREFSDLAGQIEDAIQFVSHNTEELKRLQSFPGVERLELDFPVQSRDVAVQSDAFSAALLSLMGKLEIDLVVSHYVAAPEL